MNTTNYENLLDNNHASPHVTITWNLVIVIFGLPHLFATRGAFGNIINFGQKFVDSTPPQSAIFIVDVFEFSLWHQQNAVTTITKSQAFVQRRTLKKMALHQRVDLSRFFKTTYNSEGSPTCPSPTMQQILRPIV